MIKCKYSKNGACNNVDETKPDVIKCMQIQDNLAAYQALWETALQEILDKLTEMKKQECNYRLTNKANLPALATATKDVTTKHAVIGTISNPWVVSVPKINEPVEVLTAKKDL